MAPVDRGAAAELGTVTALRRRVDLAAFLSAVAAGFVQSQTVSRLWTSIGPDDPAVLDGRLLLVPAAVVAGLAVMDPMRLPGGRSGSRDRETAALPSGGATLLERGLRAGRWSWRLAWLALAAQLAGFAWYARSAAAGATWPDVVQGLLSVVVAVVIAGSYLRWTRAVEDASEVTDAAAGIGACPSCWSADPDLTRDTLDARDVLLRRTVFAGAGATLLIWLVMAGGLTTLADRLGPGPAMLAVVLVPVAGYAAVAVVADRQRPALPDPAAWGCPHAERVRIVAARDAAVRTVLFPLVAAGTLMLITGTVLVREVAGQDLRVFLGGTALTVMVGCFVGAAYWSYRRAYHRARMMW